MRSEGLSSQQHTSALPKPSSTLSFLQHALLLIPCMMDGEAHETPVIRQSSKVADGARRQQRLRNRRTTTTVDLMMRVLPSSSYCSPDQETEHVLFSVLTIKLNRLTGGRSSTIIVPSDLPVDRRQQLFSFNQSRDEEGREKERQFFCFFLLWD